MNFVKGSHPINRMTKEETLLTLLKKERGYYRVILELTKQEADLLTQNNSGKNLQSLIKRKKILLACIDEIETSLKPLKTYWNEKTDKSDGFSIHIKNELADLDQILSAILQADQDNQQLINHCLNNLRDKMSALSSSSK